MKILLDECVTKRLIPYLSEHDVFTVTQQGWNGFRNGQLMKRAVENNFDFLITIDKNLQFQQNIGKYDLIVIVFNSPTSKVEVLKNYVPIFIEQLPAYEKGKSYLVDIV
jgi:hypothetical protein